MSQEDVAKPAEAGKMIGSLYGVLVFFLSVMLFLSTFFSTLPGDVINRTYSLVFVIGCLIVLMGTELARMMYKNGMTIVGFLGFLVFNLMMVLLAVAIFADIVGPTPYGDAIGILLALIVGSVAWYAILLLWMVYHWWKSRQVP